MDLIRKYFPQLSSKQYRQFEDFSSALTIWNEKINVISRKDIIHFEERHLLHSLSIAKFISFNPGTKIIDIGTGGGLPGIPLAIMFPECEFTLLDSIAKKIRVVNELSQTIKLENIISYQDRAENIKDKFDFVVSRAVTAFPKFYGWTKGMINPESVNEIPNGIIYLKGGNLSRELSGFGKRIQFTDISKWFEEEWFEEKKIVYLNI